MIAGCGIKLNQSSRVMQKFHLTFVQLPSEFLTLLKLNVPVTSSASALEVLGKNKALMLILEKAFSEFDDGRGLSKLATALGWENFRDRLASIFIGKIILGAYPSSTNMELVDEIKQLESRFHGHGVQSNQRVFLLGFYLKMLNVSAGKREMNFHELQLPEGLEEVLKLTQGRSERLDWLLLMVWHMVFSLGKSAVIDALTRGQQFDDIFSQMSVADRELMHSNLLAYGASIGEDEIFLYDKI
jgi:hypothetical protein